MPDLSNFVITPLAAANVNVPRATISCVVKNSQTGAIIADFTGANEISFPGVITTLTGPERLELAKMVATWLVFKKAGLN